MHPAYFSEQWSRLKARKRLFYLAWPAATGVALGGSLAAHFLGQPWLFVVCGGIGTALPAVAANYVWRFPCPRCGKHFASGIFWRNPFAGKCVHCGTAVGDGTGA